MKRFTVIFSILLVLCFGGTLAYVAATPDFVPPSAAVPAAAMGKNSRRQPGTMPLSWPTRRRMESTFTLPQRAASLSTMETTPCMIDSSCIYLSRQEKQGSMLAMMSPASATVLPRSMCGTVGVFLKLGTCMLTRWFIWLPLPTTR